MLGFCLNIGEYITFSPLFVFASLLLAGLNIPVSEDLLILTSAILARADKELLVPLYIAIFCGVIISDHMVYWEGRLINKGVLKFKFISKMLDKTKLESVERYLRKYGIFTYIVCRFIPFGIRNTLFMASGILNMPYRNFIIYDFISATISSATMYTLFYHLGASIEKPVKAVGIVLFIALILVLFFITVRLAVKWKLKLSNKAGTAGGPNVPSEPEPSEPKSL